jgi:hypothetical protein
LWLPIIFLFPVAPWAGLKLSDAVIAVNEWWHARGER